MNLSIDELELRMNKSDLLNSSEKPGEDAISIFEQCLAMLEAGEIRAARKDSEGNWHAVPWVKQAILLGFRLGKVVDLSPANGSFQFFDKHTFPSRDFTLENGIRIVPGGSTIRRGAFISPGVVCMPPMFVNVGAWIGRGTMVDSHALVGSCAQIGENVHLSAAAQIGGVLEPINASPVVIEDNVTVGGNCGVYEGTVVREKAVLGAGVVLTRGTPVYDLVNEKVIRGTSELPLTIPAGAVVVPGSRKVNSSFAEKEGISIQTPVIIKYRDDRTDAATALEAWLR